VEGEGAGLGEQQRPLLTALDRPDLIELCKLPPGRGQDPVREFFRTTFRTRTKAQWIEWFQGRDIASAKPDAIVRAGISQVPQGRGTFSDLSVNDNLLAGAYTMKDSFAEDLDYWYRTFPRLAERRDQKAGSLSGGEQQMLAIARAMMSKPKLLLCDEPSLGLAPIVTQELFRILGRLRDELGMSLLIVEQNAGLSLALADRAYVLETGSIVATGTGAELLVDDTIKEAYLGVVT